MSYVIQGKAINIIIKPSIHDLLRNCKIIDGGRSGRFLYYVLEKEGKKYIIVATYIHDHTAVYFIIFENFDKWKNEDSENTLIVYYKDLMNIIHFNKKQMLIQAKNNVAAVFNAITYRLKLCLSVVWGQFILD